MIAQTAALTAERTALDLHTRRLQATVSIIRAPGGGFDAASIRSASTKAPPAG